MTATILTPSELADLYQAEQAMNEALAAGDYDAAGALGRGISAALQREGADPKEDARG